MTITYDHMKASPCYTADVCVMDTGCPFFSDCQAVEARDDDGDGD